MSERQWTSATAEALMRETRQPDPVAAMVARADALLDEVQADGPPAPLPILASFQGIRAIESVDMVASGRLIIQSGGSIIQVNRADSLVRRNFTIAHEIAHTLLPAATGRPRIIEDAHTGDYPRTDEEEHLCDIGASALLLPERWLRPAAAQQPASLASLQALARLFKASLEATTRALARLDVWPFALVFWAPGWRKAERPAVTEGEAIPPALRVTRAIAAPSFGMYIPRNKSAPEDTSIYRAYSTGEPTSGVDWLNLRSTATQVHSESVYMPTGRDGLLQPRVVSFLLRAEAADQASLSA